MKQRSPLVATGVIGAVILFLVAGFGLAATLDTRADHRQITSSAHAIRSCQGLSKAVGSVRALARTRGSIHSPKVLNALARADAALKGLSRDSTQPASYRRAASQLRSTLVDLAALARRSSDSRGSQRLARARNLALTYGKGYTVLVTGGMRNCK